MIRASSLILRKDLRLRLRDRSVWLFAFGVPLALTFVFSLLFQFDDFELRAGVVDLDGGEVASGFTQALLPALGDEGFLETVPFEDEASARAAMEDGSISAAWVIPAGFTSSVTQGRGGDIEVLVNPDRRLAAEVARGIADGFRGELDRVSLAVATGATAAQGELDQAALEELAGQVSGTDALVSVEELIAPDRQLEPSSYLAAGMAIFFLFFTVTFGITGFLEEREQGTLPRLLAAPIAPFAIHAGKALGAFLVGVVSMVVLAVAADLALDAPWGPPVGVGILIVAAVIAALGVMALVGSFARTSEQASNLQGGVALVFGLIGGVFFPVGAGFLGTLALISPHGWFLRGLGDLAGEQVWTAVLPAAGALVLFGIVTAVPGILRLRKGGF
jgi:ABC-2 type transport system permease protein